MGLYFLVLSLHIETLEIIVEQTMILDEPHVAHFNKSNLKLIAHRCHTRYLDI